MTRSIRGRDLLVGDRIVSFTNDADALVASVEVMKSGGVMLTLDVIDMPDDRAAGQTYFIADPDAIYDVDRP
ncbi:hypothetical protein [Gordonia sp. 852002-50395_SCH5434458]|uniref:hypothetical protein n=1 Tax=Gordonia sp. 852002-50395_SCH5434458 TaxID=1834090 RepID=UPI0007EAD558|nr:hypothetical protein [Gordonia sp. 852002-50395_SCH5434458]OBC01753.1 hypothetical protein A5785_17290 [Gordonia sp. 852002-50395_SCH5434458]